MLDKLAHVKWFNGSSVVAEPAFNAVELLVVAVIVIAGLAVFRYIDGFLKKRGIIAMLDKKFKKCRPWAPLIVRLSTAALLITNFAHGFALAPNVELSDSTLSWAISGLFLAASLLIGLGLFTRVGAGLMLVGYLLVFGHADFVDALDHFEYIAITGYLYLRGPGKYSLDSYLRGGKLAVNKLNRYSLDVHRAGVGIGLVVLALSEKILNVSVAQDFLNRYDWNVMSAVGVSDRYFILVAGAIELLVGVALILNYAPRLLITVVLSLMVITAILLGIDEIYGHLFAVGIVATLWINDVKPAKNS